MENNQNVPSEEIKVKQNNNQPGPQPVKQDTKIYKILSYIGILWIIGLVVPDVKDDADVKFHVGQGMLLTIGSIALNTIISIARGILSLITGALYIDVLSILVNIFFVIVYIAIEGVILFFMIKGIINANDNKQEPLPFIGKYAFYK